MYWTFQRPRQNAYDDFLPGLRYQQSCIVYPDPKRPGSNLDTPHWVAIRQGWLDYRYCKTLENLLASAPKTDRANRVARGFRSLLDSIPWGGNIFDGDAVTNPKCNEWRRRLAKMIATLK